MPKRALYFALLVAITGMITVAAGLAQWPDGLSTTFLLCLALAVLGATFKGQVPGITGTISPSVVPVLYAIGKMSWQETAVIAAIAGVTQCVWRARRPPTKLQVLFNGSNLALSSGIAYAVSHRVAASAPLLLFLISAIVYQLVDTLSVSTILSLLEDKPLRGVWRGCHLWSFPYMVAGGAFAAGWAQADVPAGYAASLIGAIMLYLIGEFYKEIVTRTCAAS